jgi:hypothetical protein
MLPTKIHKTLVIPTNGRNLLFRSLRDKSARGRLMWSGRPRPLLLLLALSLKLFQTLAPTHAPRIHREGHNFPVVPHEDDRDHPASATEFAIDGYVNVSYYTYNCTE